MACQCKCCKGACCYDFAGTPQCSFNTCEECEAVNGEFQGIGTECTGAQSDVCPCDPPADHLQCERCVDGSPTPRCLEGQYCCDGVCQEEPCGEPCSVNADCAAGECCVSGVCEEYTGLPAEPPLDPCTNGCLPEETCCPAGCCPETWVCCPDDTTCAEHICDCPEYTPP